MLKENLKNIAAKLGILSAYDRARKIEFDRISGLIAERNIQLNSGATIIIFSKDRALQLELLIRSYSELVENKCDLKILYHSSSESFDLGYEKLKKKWELNSTFSIEWVKEKNFKTDLISIIKSVKTKKILFLVDDIFFKNQFDFAGFISINSEVYIGSLRMGNHLNFSYTLQEKQRLPKFRKEGEFLTWNYNSAVLDWAYPLSVDGHLFLTQELKVMVEELDYKAPNSFEAALQVMNPLFLMKKGLCYVDSKIINNPCNIVQQEHGNVHGEENIESLNTKWLSGFVIDYKEVIGIKNKSAHQEIKLTFKKDD